MFQVIQVKKTNQKIIIKTGITGLQPSLRHFDLVLQQEVDNRQHQEEADGDAERGVCKVCFHRIDGVRGDIKRGEDDEFHRIAGIQLDPFFQLDIVDV